MTARKPYMKIGGYMQRSFVIPFFHPCQKRKAPHYCEASSLLRGPYWVRTSDPLLV